MFNKLYLENLLAPLRHTFPITTFSRVDIYWPALPWGHDQSTVSVLAGYDRGHVCNLETTLTKHFQKDKLVSQYYECYMMTSSNGNIFSRYRSFVGGIHLSTKDSPHRGQWRGSLICFYQRINKRLKANSRDDSASRHHGAHYDVSVNVSVWSKRNAFSKGRLWSQLIDRLRAWSMSCILKMYWLFYATPIH